ncbi:hypothetical protein BN381_710003 [Candidatus Microthrix parvicella RN1]|uniref:Uncharacterized protein n=1 Tax=Candidatus Neomicrothrix parvicella RN1 TaxID=1229780 RepID=R4Z3D9_9ACTN|nr:hypothetical protein BN381_710003 [Candidatus Microthrix parvicella RN1]
MKLWCSARRLVGAYAMRVGAPIGGYCIAALETECSPNKLQDTS